MKMRKFRQIECKPTVRQSQKKIGGQMPKIYRNNKKKKIKRI